MTNAGWEDKFRLAIEFLGILAREKRMVQQEVDEIIPALEDLKIFEDSSLKRITREAACQAKLAALITTLSSAGALSSIERRRIIDIMEDIMVPL